MELERIAEELATLLSGAESDHARDGLLRALADRVNQGLGHEALRVTKPADGDQPGSPRHQRFHDRLMALVQVGNELSREATVDDIARLTVTLARERLGFERLGIWFVDPDDDRYITGSFGISEHGEIRDERAQRHLLDDDGVLNQLRQGRREAGLERDVVLHNSDHMPIGRGQRAHAPIWHGTEIIGVLFADSFLTSRSMHERDVEILALLASMLGHNCARACAEDKRSELAAAMAQANEGIVICDWLTDRITYANAAMTDISGYAVDELVGADPSIASEINPDSDLRTRIGTALGTLGTWSGRLSLRRKDGDMTPTEATVTVVRNAAGKRVSYVSIIHDLTELLDLEEQLLHARKMQAIGTLASGIAHDFNNLLTGILGAASMIQLSTDEGESTWRCADVIGRAGRRAAKLTKQLLGFARRGIMQELRVELHSIITEVTELLARTIDRSYDISLALAAPDDAVWGDPDQLQQVILNLVVNARDAMPQGGPITIATGLKDRVDGPIELHNGTVAVRDVVVEVKDAGTGIPEAIRERIFEPFFTTKHPGEGTGMGLAMVYGIIESHLGSISVESEEGRGTTFIVRLPLLTGVAEPAGTQAPQSVSTGTGARILLVDDEELVRRIGAGMLRSIGYDVVTAADGQEALELYEKAETPFDLAIVDMVMPRVGGAECCRALKRIDPRARILLSTGRDLQRAGELVGEGMAALVAKPYEIETLAAAVAHALGHDD